MVSVEKTCPANIEEYDLPAFEYGFGKTLQTSNDYTIKLIIIIIVLHGV